VSVSVIYLPPQYFSIFSYLKLIFNIIIYELRITGSKAPEGQNIGNIKLPLQYFQPQRGGIAVLYCVHKILRPSGAKKELWRLSITDILPLWGF
jgi:hypothetical protein